MIKKLFLYSTSCLLIFAACTKEKNITGPQDKSYALLSITNANASGKAIDVFIDQNKINNATFISPNANVTGTFIGVTPGNHAMIIRDTAQASIIQYYSGSLNLTGGSSYSFFLYDTLTAGSFKGILLNTDRTPDANPLNAKVRFLNLSPKSPLLDFVLVRRENSVFKDSVVLYTSVPYLGNVAAPDVPSLSAYKSVLANAGAGATSPTSGVTDYIARVKLAGFPNAFVASTVVISIIPGKNYTFYARGIYPTVTITSFVNN